MIFLALLCLLVSSTVVWPTNEQRPLVALDTLVCRDATDLHSLLYEICVRNVLCHELYYLEDGGFDKFAYQLSLIDLFGESGKSADQLFVTQLWPSVWCPYYEVRYDATGQNCSDRVPQLTFIYAATSMMMTYKEYISNEHYCNDYNERLYYDPRERRTYCDCRQGSVCNREPHFYSLITIIFVLLTGLYILVFLIEMYRTTHAFVHDE